VRSKVRWRGIAEVAVGAIAHHVSTSPSPRAADQVVQADRLKVIVSTSIANALEWFDFVAFGFFAVSMAKLFFPASNQFASLLTTFATFAIPFVVRPIGAFVLGAYADRHGRKTTLVLTIALMTLGRPSWP
jgi:MHS family proline/betaine transporter-like MFS transporter